MAYDPTTDAGTVRLLINDTTTDPVFTDAEIGRFLTLNGGRVRRAAADALDTLASNEALVSKKIRSQDLSTDGPAVAAELRARAAALRTQDDEDPDGGDGGLGIVDFDPYAGCWWVEEGAERAWWP